MSAESAEIPERIGRYEIVKRLAAGGMGEVFVARVAGPGGFVKPVALKRIHPHLSSDGKFIAMLHDEARLAASIEHPSIVRTLDVGSEGEIHYIVFDYVCGDQIGKIQRELLRRSQTIPPWVVAWVGAKIAEALHAVHEARGLDGQPLEMVHRDVSPGNIMLADSGHALLFDFGVAKAKHRLAQTTFGELKGKLSYMAPETFDGVPVDRSVDVFGLGVVLYELLTNRTPFQRQNDVDTIAALRGVEILPPSRFCSGIDRLLDDIVLKAMARRREERFRTAAELDIALRRWAVVTNSPQEAGAVAGWLAQVLPDRLARRRKLLARVASGQPIKRSRKRELSGEPTILAGVDSSTEIMPTPVSSTDGTHAGVARLTTAGRMHLADSQSSMPSRRGARRFLQFTVVMAVIGLLSVAALAIHAMVTGAPTPPAAQVAPPPAETESEAVPDHEVPEAPPAMSSSAPSPPPASPPSRVRTPTKKPTPRSGPLEREYD